MDNKKIVIDAGHGGNDPGSVANNIVEKDLNLKISQYMEKRFKELGITVKMTRTTDETVSPEERVRRVLNAFGNSPDVIVISNHINAGGGDGAEVIYALRNTSALPDLILKNFTAAGQNVRDAYQRRLPSDTSKDYYFMQRETGNTQAITVEYGFLDSPGDDVQQLKNNWQRLAEAVVQAVIEYIQGANVYIVQKGDSLWSIAKKYGITADELKNYNKLTSNLLTVGQKLRIPTKAVTPTVNYKLYTVMPGDSLYSIARNNNVTTQELITLNNLATTKLSIGQQLKIPITTTTTPSYITYTVKSGDNLYSIAEKYNTTVQKLMSYNNLKSNLLSLGQVIRIPISTGNITYTVKKGDNLYDIAQKYNTTVDEIKRKNNLKSNLLNIGQVLTI